MMKWLQDECNTAVKNKNVRWGKGLHIYFFKSSYYSSTTLKYTGSVQSLLKQRSKLY